MKHPLNILIFFTVGGRGGRGGVDIGRVASDGSKTATTTGGAATTAVCA